MDLPEIPEGAERIELGAEATQPVHDLIQWFGYGHLPPGPMQACSGAFAQLAEALDQNTHPSAEKTVALRKLLEAKDAAVRATILTMQSFDEEEAVSAEDAAIRRAQSLIDGGAKICPPCLMGNHAECGRKIQLHNSEGLLTYEGNCLCGNGCGVH